MTGDESALDSPETATVELATPPKPPNRSHHKAPAAKPSKVATKAKDATQDYLDSLDALNRRAEEAGVAPMKLLATAYLRKGLAVVEGFLGALEEGGKTAKKPGKKG